MTDLRTILRDWIHETPLSLCGVGSDTCPDWALAYALADAIEQRDTPLGELAFERLLEETERVVRQA